MNEIILFENENCELYKNDCVDVMGSLPNDSFSMVLADPPYYKITKKRWSSSTPKDINNEWDNQWKSRDEYLDWCRKWIEESIRILKDGGALYIWSGVGEKEIMAARLACLIEDDFPELKRKNWITMKNQRGFGTQKNWMSTRQELLFYIKGNDKTKYSFKPLHVLDGSVNRLKQPKRVTNVWTDINEVAIYNNHTHPSEKPMNCCKRIIEASTLVGENIFIPFAGSGNEMMASLELNRKVIGCEIDDKYADAINEKLRGINNG